MCDIPYDLCGRQDGGQGPRAQSVCTKLVALSYNKSHVVDVLKSWLYSEGLAKPATFV